MSNRITKLELALTTYDPIAKYDTRKDPNMTPYLRECRKRKKLLLTKRGLRRRQKVSSVHLEKICIERHSVYQEKLELSNISSPWSKKALTKPNKTIPHIRKRKRPRKHVEHLEGISGDQLKAMIAR